MAGRYTWQGGVCMVGAVHCKVVCVATGGHAWQGLCMVGVCAC